MVVIYPYLGLVQPSALLTAFAPALSYPGISINLRFSLHIKKFRVIAWGLGVFNAGFLFKKKYHT
jgi:hypothetical protein